MPAMEPGHEGPARMDVVETRDKTRRFGDLVAARVYPRVVA
ncbi:MAG: hypothetical protein AB7Q16_00810 [Vicinamibacterales bacterium]